MARTAKPKKEISMEEALWKSADKLRGSVEPAEYKHVVLSLFFLKFAGDKFDTQRELIAEQYGEKFMDTVAFYTKDNVFYLPPESRWSYIMENAKQDDIALKIDTALYTIEKNNPALKGALPDNYIMDHWSAVSLSVQLILAIILIAISIYAVTPIHGKREKAHQHEKFRGFEREKRRQPC